MSPIRVSLRTALVLALLSVTARAEDSSLPGLVATLPPLKDESHLYSIQWSKDGKQLVTVLGKTVHFYDTGTWKEVRKLTMPDEERPLHLAPDAKSFVWLEGSHGKSPLSVYDAETGEVSLAIEQRPHVGPVNQVALTDDGKTFIAAGSLNGAPNLWRWDVATGALAVTTMAGINDIFYALAITPDGKTAAGGVNRGVDHIVIVLDVATGKELQRLKTGDAFAKSLAFSADGTLLAAAAQGEHVRLFDVSTGKMLSKFDHEYPACVRFSPDGKLLLTSDREQFCLWDVGGKKLAGVFGRLGVRVDVHNPAENANAPESGAAFSPDGKRLAWGCEKEEWGTVRVYDVDALLKAGAPK